MHQSMWMKTSLMESLIFLGPYLWSKQASRGYCKADIMHLIGVEASAMSDLSRIWCQMRLTLASKLRVYQRCVSTHSKVSMSTRLWDLNHSVGSRKYIRFWDHELSADWRKATRCIPREMSAKNHRPGVTWLCRQREVRTRTRLVPLRQLTNNLSSSSSDSSSRVRSSGKSSSADSGWRPKLRRCHGHRRNTWLQRTTVDTVKYLRTEIFDLSFWQN